MQRETYNDWPDITNIPGGENVTVGELEVADLSIRKRKYRGNDEVSETIDLSMKKRKFSGNRELLADDDNVPNVGNSDGDKMQLKPSSFRAACFHESYDESYCTDHIESYQKVKQNDYQPESSDSDDVELPPLPKLKDLSEQELCEKEMKICKLREELRNEEVKLVLLKKLRQSQTVKDSMSATQPLPGKVASPACRNVQSRSGSVFLDRGRNSVLSGKIFEQNAPQHPLTVSQMIRNQNLQGSSSVLMGSKSGLHSTLPANVMMRPGVGPPSRIHVTTPPNVVMGYPASNRSSSHQINSGHALSLLQSSASISPQISQGSERVDNQTPAQRQAVAKLALRKQLEKTLLQIPPPKPPPPEMHFIPNANNQEFICLLGLEKVVDFTMHDSTGTKSPPDPFFCVQCGTDFTPVWKWQDTFADFGKKRTSVICETCVTTNIKKALKAEHTNRLKTAFVKALQQEQEIEQNMSLVIPSPPPSTSPLTPPLNSIQTTVFSNSHGTPPPSSHSPIPRIGISNPSAAFLQQLPNLTPAQQSILQAQAHQLHQLAQSLPQPAHMLPFNPLLPQPYSYQMLGKSAITSTDLQRQYLLDMIPSRPLPQSSTNWKS